MAVLVLDKMRQPLMPGSQRQARLLLTRGRAVVVPRADGLRRQEQRFVPGLMPEVSAEAGR